MHVMKIRDKYQLKTPKGVVIDYREHEADLVAAAKAAIPDKPLNVYDDHLLVDELTRREAIAFGRAVAKIPDLNSLGLKKITKVFCELNGEPICGKERFCRLAAEENRLARETFEAEYGPDADEDDYVDW